MEQIQVKIERFDHGRAEAIVPRYATDGSAGMDLHACLKEDLLIEPGKTVKVPTGIAIELPGPHLVALVFARSGLAANKGISLANAVGVIDSDYRGEIGVLIQNNGIDSFKISHGDRIAQILFMPVFQAVLIEEKSLKKTARGVGGFGSTGL
ncbi:MAG: dUTP diphosphatase [Desulfitobacterium hafniense]|nr:dUTP diphosphatase [Desulfitobacterium hafniense]